MSRRYAFGGMVALLLVFSSRICHAGPESLWGAQQRFTQKGGLRYLVLLPPHYDPHRKYELWITLHGSPGAPEHANYMYHLEAQQHEVIMIAPNATGDATFDYDMPDGKKGKYRFWNMRSDPANVLAVLDEVEAIYPIDRWKVALLGFSAGCEMGWRLLALRPDTFYFFGGVANGFPHGKPPVSAALLRRAARHTAHFYAAGKDDAFAGPMFKTTARKLKQYGFNLRTAFPPGVGHALPPSIETPLLGFMDEVRSKIPPDSPAAAPAGRTAVARPGVTRNGLRAVLIGIGLLGVAILWLRNALVGRR